jgi:quercetin dioxygenase-like cupin family protein
MKLVKAGTTNWIQADGYRKNILMTEDQIGSRGNLAQIVVVEADSKVKPHYHKRTSELIYVTDGSCLFTVNDSTFPLQTGDLLLTEPGDIHSLINNGQTAWRALVFKINAVADDSFWSEKAESP